MPCPLLISTRALRQGPRDGEFEAGPNAQLHCGGQKPRDPALIAFGCRHGFVALPIHQRGIQPVTARTPSVFDNEGARQRVVQTSAFRVFGKRHGLALQKRGDEPHALQRMYRIANAHFQRAVAMMQAQIVPHALIGLETADAAQPIDMREIGLFAWPCFGNSHARILAEHAVAPTGEPGIAAFIERRVRGQRQHFGEHGAQGVHDGHAQLRVRYAQMDVQPERHGAARDVAILIEQMRVMRITLPVFVEGLALPGCEGMKARGEHRLAFLFGLLARFAAQHGKRNGDVVGMRADRRLQFDGASVDFAADPAAAIGEVKLHHLEVMRSQCTCMCIDDLQLFFHAQCNDHAPSPNFGVCDRPFRNEPARSLLLGVGEP